MAVARSLISASESEGPLEQPGESAAPAEAPVQPGEILLSKYRVERTLGKGGMGVVLAVRHLELGELYALKLLRRAALTSPGALSRFLREARASARLKGEHVTKVFDVGRLDDGSPYMLMEHLEGKDLKALLLERGPLPVDEVVGCVLQACEALAEAHAQGIVHRDLKPSNLILVRRPNGSPCVKVIDFGISKVVAPDGADLTRSWEVLGTPLYMSPEQMMQSKSIDARSDVWSMGVVLYELLTGRLPFEGDVFARIVTLVLNEEPAPARRLRPDLPGWLDAIITRCLRKKPEERFQSVDELAAALRSRAAGPADALQDIAFVDTLPVHSERTPRRAAQETLPAAEPAPAAETAAAPPPAPAAPASATPAQRPGRARLRAGLILVAVAVGLGGVWLALRSTDQRQREPAPTPPAEAAAPAPAPAPRREGVF